MITLETTKIKKISTLLKPQAKYDFVPQELKISHKKNDAGFLVCWIRVGKKDSPLFYGNHTEILPEEELFRIDSLETLRGVPITLDHPPGFFFAGKYFPDSEDAEVPTRDAIVGMVMQDFQREESEDNAYLTVPCIIFDKDAIAAIESGEKIEISPGYLCEVHYDSNSKKFYQKNRIYDHVAIVEKGRTGSDVHVKFDSEGTEVIVSKTIKVTADSETKKLVQTNNNDSDCQSKTLEEPMTQTQKTDGDTEPTQTEKPPAATAATPNVVDQKALIFKYAFDNADTFKDMSSTEIEQRFRTVDEAKLYNLEQLAKTMGVDISKLNLKVEFVDTAAELMMQCRAYMSIQEEKEEEPTSQTDSASPDTSTQTTQVDSKPTSSLDNLHSPPADENPLLSARQDYINAQQSQFQN